MNRQQKEALKKLLGDRVRWDVSMAEHSTFRAGGRAEALADVGDREELQALVRWLRNSGVPWRIIGRGSNILVSGQGFAGVIVRLQGELASVEQERGAGHAGAGTVPVRAGGGCSMARLLAWCTGRSLAGLEFLAGIPGSVGGGVRMNAGAWGQAMGGLLQALEVLDDRGRLLRLEAGELRFSYRRLELAGLDPDRVIIVSAWFGLRLGRQAEIVARCRDYLARRREKQPAGVGSAGSFFKNPAGDHAGRLIEAAGLKGLARGDAMVSPRHANFIVNTGRATADDIAALMVEVQERVYRDSGIRLEPEVCIF
ncbi:MAG TPA: UDP-N-acetylmuramate dehydrogenase [Desulfobulbus sp.]|nr:UDP-N-acetylmuramate dehydrogenase [Desulfobulbus sp.]